MVDAQRDFAASLRLDYPCPKCRTARGDVEAACPQCHWQPNQVLSPPQPFPQTTPLPRSAIIIRRILVASFVFIIGLNLLPTTLPPHIVIGWPGWDDPNWVRSHAGFGFPHVGLSISNNTNHALQISDSAWTVYPANAMVDLSIQVLPLIAFFTIGFVMRHRPQSINAK